MIGEDHDDRGSDADKRKDEAPSDGGGEDEGSTSVEGKDDHLKDDQKPIEQGGKP